MNRWLIRSGIALVVALGLAIPAHAAGPDGSTPGSAMPIAASASGSLTGSTGGSYLYYTFDYPGSGIPGTITISVDSTNPATVGAVGVSLWQGGNHLASVSAMGSTPGANTATFSSSTPGPVLAQVYNYTPGVPVSFQLGLAGFSQAVPAPVAAPAPPPAPTPVPTGLGTASDPIPLTQATSGTLSGTTGGSYIYYTINSKGDGSTERLTLYFSPGGPDLGNAVFLNLYQNGNPVASGQGINLAAEGVLPVSFASVTAGPVLVQVDNQTAGRTISYTLSQ